MTPATREEIWFARIAIILGARELVDAGVNLVTVCKLHSGLSIVTPGTDEIMAVPLLISSAIAGFYLVSGGQLLSRIAYDRAVTRIELLGECGAPAGAGCVSIAFRTIGALHLIKAISSFARAVAYHFQPLSLDTPRAPSRLFVVESAWTLEHLAIGFALVWLGGRIATFFLGRVRPNQSTEPSSPSQGGSS